MANTKSAKKRARQTPKRTARNIKIRSGVKTALRNAREAIQGNSQDAQTILKNAISSLAKAASKGSVHKKNASRKISRLTKMANKAAAAPAPAAAVTKTKTAAKAKTTARAKA